MERVDEGGLSALRMGKTPPSPTIHSLTFYLLSMETDPG